MSTDDLVRAESLSTFFPIQRGFIRRSRMYVQAVNDVSFAISPQETFGVVGESGCGKTTLGRTILRLIDPTGGKIYFDGKDITVLEQNQMKVLREQMQLIFQDPYSALHPRKTVEALVGEPLLVHNVCPKDQVREKVLEMMTHVGLNADQLRRYPHELSGGQRQRVVIARALILNPRFLVLDEPTSSLDASVQALILNLLRNIQRERKLTYLLISHHMSVVEYLSDRIGVMYLGKIVEIGPKAGIFSQPLHPYTQALLASVPKIGEDGRRNFRAAVKGDVPSPINLPSGCSFHTRCPYARERCSQEVPELREADRGRLVACHFFEEIQASPQTAR